MIFILSLSGGEADHFVKYRKTTLTGKEKVIYERMRDFSFGETESRVRVSTFIYPETNLYVLKSDQEHRLWLSNQLCS